MSVQAVVSLLIEDGKYQIISDAIHISELVFRFDAMLIGPGDERGLVIVLDIRTEPLAPLRRRLRSFAQVMQRTGPNRPLTAVLVGSTFTASELHATRSVCRVILVDPQDGIRSSLTPLLPLTLPDPVTHTVSATTLFRTQLAGKIELRPLGSTLLRASERGSDTVRDAVRDRVARICRKALNKSGDK